MNIKRGVIRNPASDDRVGTCVIRSPAIAGQGGSLGADLPTKQECKTWTSPVAPRRPLV